MNLPLLPTPGLPDNIESVKARSSDNPDPHDVKPEEWQSLVYSVQDLAKFDAVAIKVVMTTQNPAKAPLVDDFQLIVTE